MFCMSINHTVMYRSGEDSVPDSPATAHFTQLDQLTSQEARKPLNGVSFFCFWLANLPTFLLSQTIHNQEQMYSHQAERIEMHIYINTAHVQNTLLINTRNHKYTDYFHTACFFLLQYILRWPTGTNYDKGETMQIQKHRCAKTHANELEDTCAEFTESSA